MELLLYIYLGTSSAGDLAGRGLVEEQCTDGERAVQWREAAPFPYGCGEELQDEGRDVVPTGIGSVEKIWVAQPKLVVLVGVLLELRFFLEHPYLTIRAQVDTLLELLGI